MGEPDRPEHAEVLTEVRAHVFVSGRVQGVFFRYFCAREASSSRLHGFVRNLSDGRVEAVFQGPKDAVERLVTWCHVGSPAARVDHVEVSWVPISDELPAF